MPTGYTAPILDGDIKTFKEYAILCIRNFGATMHMRDNPLEDDWIPSTPSDYYPNRIKMLKAKLSRIERQGDIQLSRIRLGEFEKRISENVERIKERKEKRLRIDSILAEAKAWQPPTNEHTGYRDFMIDQLEKTLSWDCDTIYYEDDIVNTRQKIKNFDVKEYRKEIIAEIKEDIKRCKEEYEKDENRCAERNKWVTDVFKTLS